MRKYILSVIFILAGILFLFIGLSKGSNKNLYAESAFAERSEEFEKGFSEFTVQIQAHIEEFKRIYNERSSIRDTLATRNFFLDKISQSEELTTLGFFQNGYKVETGKASSMQLTVLKP